MENKATLCLLNNLVLEGHGSKLTSHPRFTILLDLLENSDFLIVIETKRLLGDLIRTSNPNEAISLFQQFPTLLKNVCHCPNNQINVKNLQTNLIDMIDQLLHWDSYEAIRYHLETSGAKQLLEQIVANPNHLVLEKASEVLDKFNQGGIHAYSMESAPINF